VTTSTRVGLIEDIVISIVVFLVVSLRNTDGTVIQGANSVSFRFDFTDQEVISKYLAMTVKEKITVCLVIDAIAGNK
jgi:hypothetical protein